MLPEFYVNGIDHFLNIILSMMSNMLFEYCLFSLEYFVEFVFALFFIFLGDVLVNNGSLTSGVVEYEQISADYSNSAYISIIIGTLCIFIIVLSLIAIVAIICYKRRKSFDRYFTNKESKFNAFNSLGTTFTNNKALGTSNYNPVSSADAYSTESSPPFVRVVYGNNVYEEPFEGSPNHRLLIDNEQNKRLSISNTSGNCYI